MMEKISLMSASDYRRYLRRPLQDNFTDSAPAVNQWAYNDSLRAIHINTDNTLKGSLEISAGNLCPGDVVEIEVEFLNVSGVKGKVAIDQMDGNILVGNRFIYSSTKVGEFERVKIRYISNFTGESTIVIGIFTPDVGELYIRNVRVAIDGQRNNRRELAYVEARKTYAIHIDNGNVVFATGYGHDRIGSFVIENNKLTLIHQEAFTRKTEYTERGAHGFSMAAKSGVDGYLEPGVAVYTGSERNDRLDVLFYKDGTNEAVPISSIKSMWINVIHFGWNAI